MLLPLSVTDEPFLLAGAALILAAAALRAHRQRHRLRRPAALAAAGVGLASLLAAALAPSAMASRLGDELADGVVLQTSPATCAAASGANIARFYGHPASERSMAEAFHSTDAGASTWDIVRGMRRAGFACRPLAGRATDLEHVAPPLMLFIDYPGLGRESHAVVYAGTKDGALVILDPLRGRVHWHPAPFRKRWHGKGIACRPV